MNWLKTFLLGLTAVATGFGADITLNPYADRGTKFEIESVSTIPDAGTNKIELAKDKPEITLSRWWGETQMTVTPVGLYATGTRPLFTNRVEWKGNKQEVHAYPLDAKEGMEDGGFEIEVVLNSKPASNIFDFAISGAEELDFFYQLELTPEEIAEGNSRPENVVGSYAVYHKMKSNHRIGSTNYATGKAFHIYRPKAIDANGVEVWADLHIENGILTVTVPQKFLDDAVYPVRVDPTFGYTNIGVSSSAFTQDNVRISRPGTSPASDGTLNSISLYSNDATPDPDTAWRPVFYNDTTLALITTGAEDDLTGASWHTKAVTEVSIVSSVSYGIGLWVEGAIGDSWPAVYDTVVGVEDYRVDRDALTYHATNNPNDPFVVDGTGIVDRRYSIYATYTPTTRQPDQIIFNGSANTLPTSGTNYGGIMGQGELSYGSTIGVRNLSLPTPGDLYNLRIVLNAAPGAGTSYIFALEVNGTASALTCTIADTATSCSDTTNIKTVIPGDDVAIKLTVSGTPTARAMRYSLAWDASTAGETILLGNTNGSNWAAGSTDYAALASIPGTSPTGTETSFYTVIPTAGTVKNLYSELDTAPAAGKTRVFTVRKNGADTAVYCNISGTATSCSTATTTLSFTVAAGDKINVSQVPSGTPTNSAGRFGIVFDSDTAGEFIVPFIGVSQALSTASSDEYTYLAAGGVAARGSIATRMSLGQASGETITLDKLYFLLDTAPGVATTRTFTVRKNGTATDVLCTISGTDTTCNDTGSSAVANDDYFEMEEDLTGSPAASFYRFSTLFTIAQAAAAGAGFQGVFINFE